VQNYPHPVCVCACVCVCVCAETENVKMVRGKTLFVVDFLRVCDMSRSCV